MKKSAEDIELSCDETVLMHADHNTRKKYATLLLDNVSDNRGFTTCLATSAKSMHYRLKHIVKPEKRLNGAVIVGLVFFVLCMTIGYVALAYDDRSGSEVIYNNSDYSQYHLHSISMEDGAKQRNGKLTDEAEAAFHEYLSELTLSELTSYYSFSEYDTQFNCIMDTPEGTQVVQLYDNVINITKLYGENPSRCYYYIQDGVDWEYLRDIVLLFN